MPLKWASSFPVFSPTQNRFTQNLKLIMILPRKIVDSQLDLNAPGLLALLAEARVFPKVLISSIVVRTLASREVLQGSGSRLKKPLVCPVML